VPLVKFYGRNKTTRCAPFSEAARLQVAFVQRRLFKILK